MIVAISVLIILLFLLCCAHSNTLKELNAEKIQASKLKADLFVCQHDLNQAHGQIKSLETELNQEPKTQTDDQDLSRYVRITTQERATAQTYRNVFDVDADGQRVLAHLQAKFASKSSYVRGSHEAERESCFRAGQAFVIGHIINQINQANNADYGINEEFNDD